MASIVLRLKGTVNSLPLILRKGDLHRFKDRLEKSHYWDRVIDEKTVEIRGRIQIFGGDYTGLGKDSS